VTPGKLPGGDAAARARAWRDSAYAAVCDVLEPWAHGTVARASRYSSYFNFNVVLVEEDPGMGIEALVAFADEALAGLAHRRIDFDLIDVAEPLRPDFEARGWTANRILWMRHEAVPPPGPEVAVEEVPYDVVPELRVAWHREDFPDMDPGGFHAQEREVALRHHARVLASMEGGEPVAFAQLVGDAEASEISHVYVRPDYRGHGRGTAITRAAIAAAGDVGDLWITADDEDRPKELYARLGFRPAWTTMEFQLPPERR
jgi:GNAT superfamily N-acetyltransferase